MAGGGGRLSGKTALITGAARGVGRALALKLASEGASLVLNDADGAPLAETVALVKASGGGAAACEGSITDAGFPDAFVATAIRQFGGLDIIVNNAGYTWFAQAGATTDEQLDVMMDVHVKAPFRILRAAFDPIRAQHERERSEGREVFRKIVNVSSLAGLYGVAGQVAYSTAKSALVGMTRTLCKEWGRYAVNVNCVAFGLIDTRLMQTIEDVDPNVRIDGHALKVGVKRQFKESTAQITPLGRIGKPEEAADAVYLFCSPESNYISGQVVVAGGGLLI